MPILRPTDRNPIHRKLDRETARARPVYATQPTNAAAATELATLYAALDNIENGVILLDRELRAQYANPALHAMFNSPAEFVHGKPLFAEMLEHARRTRAYAVSPDELRKYVSERLAWVVAGDQPPVDQRLSSGRVIRCQCAVLPAGGRMLTYSDITDIVHHAEELERLATTDGMTGIYNRRHFMTLADIEWGRSRRYRRPLSFLMIDIDFFKSINDRFGHETGDQMIVHLTKVATACKRDSDVLARIGGEEFGLLLPETDLAQSLLVAERLRREVAENPLVAETDRISTTISIGAASRDDAMTGISDLMKVADRALYEAKNGGRNRVVCATGAGNAVHNPGGSSAPAVAR
ncbi:MAG: diguanylate cyclase [Mesorhizobium sp.]|nr:sensor domain-containing diguanylate cyclase [Mesorhizobium sp.]MCO5160352.1 diguanylate cyclase [Mesorhizobium sp.]